MKKIFVWFSFLLVISAVNCQTFEADTSSIFKKFNFSDGKFFDCNNDKKLDLILSGEIDNFYSINQTIIYQNLGGNNFEELMSSNLPDISFSDISVTDVDNDGDIDFFISGLDNSGLKISQIYLNNGSCLFVASQNILQPVCNGDSFFIDADKDGDNDLITFGSSVGLSQQTNYYKNNGAGLFSLHSDNQIVALENGSIDTADVDQDNDIDIIVSGSNVQNNHGITNLYINNGFGDYSVDTTNHFLGQSFGLCKFMDIDGDDDKDIFVMGLLNGAYSAITMFYENDGNGSYSEIGDRGVLNLKQGDFDYSDIDLDGDLDLFVSANYGPFSTNVDSAILYLNNEAYFTRDTNFNFIGIQGFCAFGNTDENCAEELFFTGFNELACNMHTNFLINQNTDSCKTLPVIIDSLPNNLAARIYPNPSIGEVNIYSEIDLNFYKVYDLSGTIIFDEKDFELKNFQIDISALEKGVYTLFYGNSTKEYSFRIVKTE